VSTFFNTRLGFLIFTAGVIVALIAAPALGRISRDDRKAQASIDNTAGVIDGEIVPVRAEGGPCQYTVTYGTHTIVPGDHRYRQSLRLVRHNDPYSVPICSV